jgi:hypothetical protein
LNNCPDFSEIFRKSGILCGIAGPPVYIMVVAILGFIIPGYDHATQLMSVLGETWGPYALVMNLAGFVLIGFSIIMFAGAFYFQFRTVRAAVPATALLLAAGLCYLGEAYFHCDPGCVPVTSAGLIHLQIGGLLVVIMVIAIFVIAWVLKSEGHWHGYWQYSVLTGTGIILFLPVLISAQDIPGLTQRFIVGIIFLWWEILAVAMYFSPIRRDT